MQKIVSLMFVPVMIILGGFSMSIGAVNTALAQPVSDGAPAALVMALVSVVVSALGGGWLAKRISQNTSS